MSEGKTVIIILSSTVQCNYSTGEKIQYFIKYSAVQYKAVQCIAAPHSAMKGTAVQKSTVQCSEQQCRKVQCNALPCYVMDGSAVHCGTLYPPTLVYD